MKDFSCKIYAVLALQLTIGVERMNADQNWEAVHMFVVPQETDYMLLHIHECRMYGFRTLGYKHRLANPRYRHCRRLSDI